MIADDCTHGIWKDGLYSCEMNPAWLVDDESCYGCSEFESIEVDKDDE